MEDLVPEAAVRLPVSTGGFVYDPFESRLAKALGGNMSDVVRKQLAIQDRGGYYVTHGPTWRDFCEGCVQLDGTCINGGTWRAPWRSCPHLEP